MKKGFTLIEILGVILIMAMIILIAIPTYKNVTSKIKQNIYESKVKELLAKGESYAEETGNLTFHVNTLIESGKLTPDNETGIYKDPRSDRKMNCDIIKVNWEENYYKATLIENNECFTEEELNNRYGIVTLRIIDENGKTIPSINGTDWLNRSKVYVSYELKQEYKSLESSIENISWSGEEEMNCTKENISNCEKYSVTTNSTKMVTVGFKLTMNYNGSSTSSVYTQNVFLDIVAPEVKMESIIINNEYSSNQERKVNFEITDYNGSGIKEYGLVKNKTCNGSEYNANRKNASEGVQTEYLPNGTYYICVMDKVGNKTNDNVLEQTKIVVDNVDNSIPSVSLSIKSKDARYQTKDVNLTITASDDGGVSNLKMCISNTGYLQNCSWEAYTNTKAWSLTGNYDGGVRTVYVTVQDDAGNIAQNKANYTIYKSCSRVTSWQEKSNTKSSCPKCGTAYYSATYKKYDYYLGGECQSKVESKSCGLKSCDPVETMDPNNYESSTKVTCDANYFKKLLEQHIDKFETSLNYQNFRNALYDCASVTESLLAKSDAAYNILRNHSRTTIVSGKGKSKTCTCYYNKESKSAMKTCEKPACSYEYSQFVSANLYNGKILVLSATSNTKRPDWGTPSGLCGDDNGFGDCENEGSTWEKYGYGSILIGDKNNNIVEATGWGYCTKTTNAIINWDDCGTREERKNRIATFQNGLTVGLYAYQDWYYFNNERQSRDKHSYKNGIVYVQIFII